MFDQLLKKSEDALSRLNQALTLFEKEFLSLKNRYEEDLKKYKTEADSHLVSVREAVEKSFSGLLEKLSDFDANGAKILEEYKAQLISESERIIREKTNRFDFSSLEYIEKFKITTDDYIKQLQDMFEKVYSVSETNAKIKAEQILETDLEKIFEKYGDRIIPAIFKALFQYVFKRKK